MIKFLLLFLLLFSLISNTYGQFLTVLNGNTPFETKDISDISLIRNYKGELFLFYYKNNTLCVKKSTDNGQSFSVYDPGLESYGFTAVRGIIFFERTVRRQYIFFVGTKNGREGIYYLAFNEDGIPVPGLKDPLDIETIEGGIIRYKPYYIGGGEYCLLYIKGNTLGYTFINNPDTEIIKHIVWENGTVNDFDFKGIVVDKNSRESGTYTIKNGYTQSLRYFEYNRSDPVYNNILAEGITNGECRYIYTTSGIRCYVFLKENSLYAMRLVNGQWSAFNNNGPVSCNVQGTIVSFDSYLADDLLFTVFTSMYNGNEYVYMSKCRQGGECSLLNNGNPLSSQGTLANSCVSFLVRRNIIISFLYGEDYKIWCKKFSIDDDTWTSMETEMAGTGVYHQIRKTLFHNWYNIISIAEKDGTDYQLSSYVFDYKTDSIDKLSSVPLFPVPLPVYTLKVMNGDILLLHNGGIFTFIDYINGMYESTAAEGCYEIKEVDNDTGFLSVRKSDGLYLYGYSVKK